LARRALVIGIDGYTNAAWRLDGAVRDALAFANWAVGAGGVAPEDLRLLLSPAPGAPSPVVPAGAPPPSPPTSQGVIDALASLRRLKPEEGGDRVYVYYAGHGAALQGFNEPILIPVDFSDPEVHGQLLLGFSKVVTYLGPAPFKEQVFFLDACRDFGLPGYEPPLQSPVGPFRPAKGAAKQYLLYSVALGQRATEIGAGIWTQTLLAGLEGRSYKPVTLRLGKFVVHLDDLAAWVREEVRKRLEMPRQPGATLAAQEPEYVPDPKGGDPVLVTFPESAVPRARVSVFVEPALAHSTCRVDVKEYSAAHAGALILVTSGPLPPIAPPLEFELFPSEYSFEAHADNYTRVSQPWTVGDEPLVELTLEKMPPPSTPPAPPAAPPVVELENLERSAEPTWRGNFGLDDLDLGVPGGEARGSDGWRGIPEIPAMTRSEESQIAPPFEEHEPPASGPGTLTVFCQDPHLRIKLLDARRREVQERTDLCEPLPLAPGIYRLRAWLPGDRPTESTVEVRPGRPTIVSLSVPPPRLGSLQMSWLQERGVGAEYTGGKLSYLRPAEHLGAIAGMRLGSLLAYAAYAANRPGPFFRKLRSLGVQTFAAGTSTGVLVLAGVAGGRSEKEIEDFLGSCQVDVQWLDGQSAGAGSFTPLPGMPAAAAWQTALDRPGSLRAELRLPGFGATRYALAALPGRLSVLVAALESDGTVDVQQFLFPLGQETPWRDFLEEPQNVRTLDMAVRAWAAHERHPLRGRDLEDLLAGHWIDPILACVAGYSLVRAGEPGRFLGETRRGMFDGLDPDSSPQARRLQKSALANLLSLFPGLPDAWVLAGLCDPVGEEDWFEKAVRCGVPLFTAGLHALGARPEFAELLVGLLPGSPWTAWARSAA
jgi:hypothetical protein